MFPRTLQILVLFLLTLPSLPALADPVSITKSAPKIERKTFDPDHLPTPPPPLHEHEIAVCEYFYRIELDFRFTPGQPQPTLSGAVRVPVRIDRITARLMMPVTVWLPQKAPDNIKSHEEAHRAIAEHFYKDADKIAADLCKALIGQTVEAEGKDANAATNAALQKAAQQLSDAYIAAVKAPCDKAQKAFDQITDHAMNRDITAEKAIPLALEQAKKN